MKKLLTLIFSSCVLVLFAQTNAPHYITDTAAVWCESHTYGLCPITERRILRIDGDTVIGTQSYSKLTASGYRYCGVSPWNYFSNEYCGALREDTLSRRVYYVEPFSTVEILRYDFTWSVGDTIPGYYSQSGTVSSVDSVLIGSTYRKRWWTSSFTFGDSACIVEGIGSSLGLYRLDMFGVESYPYLNAYSLNGTEVWMPDSLMPCMLPTGFTGSSQEEPALQIIPNPNSGSFVVHFTNPDQEEATLELCDVTGRMITSPKQNVAATTEFSCTALPDGIYFLRVITTDAVVTKEIIVRHE